MYQLILHSLARLTITLLLLTIAHAAFAQSLDSLPSDFPLVHAAVDSSQKNFQTETGAILLANFSFRGTPQSGFYLMILQPNGTPIFYRKMPAACIDLKVQPNGLLTYMDESTYRFYALDTNYNVVDSFYCGNSVRTDTHDLEILPNGHALLLGVDSEIIDMSALLPGGNSAATVIGNRVQEIDENKKVVFDWNGFDHFSITDCTGVDLTAPEIDFEHSNAVQLDTDGTIIMSSRHLDEVTKINRTTGNIVWRWGGAHNMFTMIGDTIGFSHQHDPRRIANGNITLFDNGNLHSPPFSRALEFKLDEKNMTATKVWEYEQDSATFSFAMGNVQRLDNGNTFIGWGSQSSPAATEVTPDGKKVYEMGFSANNSSYRAYRQQWKTSQSPLTVSLSQTLGFNVLQNYPNPFSGSTLIYFTLDHQGPVELAIYDELGRKVETVAQGSYGVGTHSIAFNSANLNNGVYFATLNDHASVRATRMVVAK
jgi:hypothetical protein